MASGAVVGKLHAQFGGDHGQRSAYLSGVSHKNHLAVLQLLAPGKIFHNGTQITDLLGGVVVIAHAVQHGNGAGLSQLHHGLVVDDPCHDNVCQLAQHLAGVANGLVAAQLDHAGTEILGMAAQLAHCGLKGDAGAGRGLLKDHAQRLVFHQRRVIARLDAVLDLQGQFDDVHQFLLGENAGVDKVTQFCSHIELPPEM